MAKIFQIPKRVKNPATGKMVEKMDPKTGKPMMYARWRVRICDWQGRRRNVTLSKNKAEAQKQADLLEMQALEMKKGLRPTPTPESKAKRRPFLDIMEEYLAWGNAQGGRKGRPWSPTHARDRRSVLLWWQKTMKFAILSDVEGCLPSVEQLLRTLAITGREHSYRQRKKAKALTGKTLNEYAGALKAFFSWCAHKSRRYLIVNPLDGISSFDATPSVLRRALPPEEMLQVLDAAPTYLRLLFETAICTGLRRGELRALTLFHLNPAKMTLRIDASRDKARKLRYQKIPERLCQPLLEFARSGEPQKLYDRHYQGRDGSELAIPPTPLLFVPTHSARALRRIARHAGVPEVTDEGKLDFHALRTSYINLLYASGADPKTVQELARHDTAAMTLNIYGRANVDRMTAAAEAVGEMLVKEKNAQKTPNTIG